MSIQAAILTSDLFFTSQLEAGANQAGLTLTMTGTWERLESLSQAGGIAAVIVDLAHPAAADVKTLVQQIRSLADAPIRIIAFAQHVQIERIKKAREAGCDLVTTRGDISRSLADQLSS
jgi:CheY-like chemotaxis protein